MSAIGLGLKTAIDLIPTDTAGAGPVDGETFAVAMASIVEALTVLADTMDSADSKSQEAVTAATDAATQLEEVGSDVKLISEHTINTIIPHSLSWLAGYVMSHWIAPLRADVAWLKDRVNFILGWRDQIDTWRHKFVDPNVERWIGFHQWFVTWPQSVLFRWHEWFDKPAEFAQWATPPLVGPIVSYLAAPGHKQTRDNLMLIMLRAMQEDVNPAWDDVLRFMVTDK